MLSFLTKSLWLSDSAIKTLEIWLFVPSVHQRQDQDKKYLALFYPASTDTLPIRCGSRKAALFQPTITGICCLCVIFFFRFYPHDLMNLKQKEALLALDFLLISYILRKILGGIDYKYDATSLQRL